MAEQDNANTFRAIIATDNHLGYLEKDPIRGQDSFIAFEEIFKEAIKRKAMGHERMNANISLNVFA